MARYILATLCVFLLSPALAYGAGVVRPPSNSGLLGYWPLNESSGSTARDTSGNSKHATLTLSPTWTSSGKFGGALTFGASNNYASTTVRWPSSGTISVWAYPTSIGDWRSPAGWKSGATSAYGYALIDMGNASRWRAVFRPNIGGAAEANISGLNTFSVNRWYHLAMTWSLVSTTYTVNFYVNGVYQGQTTWTGTPSSIGLGNFHFGNSGDYADNYFVGRVDEPRTYNRALSGAEIAALYATQGVAVYATATSTQGLNLDFENTDAGTCPSGWRCSGDAETASSGDAGGCAIGTSANGSKWLKLGCDNTVGIATSTAFVLPFNISYISFLRTGGADGPGSGLYVRHATSSATLCSAETGTDTDAFFTDTCTGLSAYRGQRVVIVAVDNVSGSWGKTYVDNIRLHSATGAVLTPPSAGTQASSISLQRGSPLESGLVGHWTFDGADFTTSVADKSGQGNAGYLPSGVATSSVKAVGKLGQGLSLNGSSAAVNVADNAALDPSTVTVSAWIKRTTSAASFPVILSKESGSTGYVLHLQDTDEIKWKINGDEATDILTTSADLSTGTWYHVVGTYDGTNLRLYINGVLSDTSPKTGAVADSSIGVTIGQYGDADNKFSGVIDDVRVYSRALTATEVKQLYLMGK